MKPLMTIRAQRMLVAMIAAIGLGAALASTVDVQASFPGANGQLIFWSARDGNPEIFRANSDGTGQVNVTNSPSADYPGGWSPDGARFAFYSNRNGNMEVYTAAPDGSDVTNVTNHSAGDTSPSWTPDGRLLFTSDRAGTPDLFVVAADGTGVTRLTSDSSSEWSARAAPDGTKIAFVGDLDHDGKWDVYAADADGSGATEIDPANGRDDYDPSWAPDSSRLVFWSGPSGNPNEIYSVHRDGTVWPISRPTQPTIPLPSSPPTAAR